MEDFGIGTVRCTEEPEVEKLLHELEALRGYVPFLEKSLKIKVS